MHKASKQTYWVAKWYCYQKFSKSYFLQKWKRRFLYFFCSIQSKKSRPILLKFSIISLYNLRLNVIFRKMTVPIYCPKFNNAETYCLEKLCFLLISICYSEIIWLCQFFESFKSGRSISMIVVSLFRLSLCKVYNC